MRQRYRVVDLFCGAGGFSRGFAEEGFEIVLGVDNMRPVAEAFRLNFPHAKVLVEDVKLLHGEDIESLVGEVDVVIGGPPCEPFTSANPKRREDPLERLYTDPVGRLVLDFIRIVGDLRPKIFVMENVPALAEGPLKEALRKEFARVGYDNIYFNLLLAEDYGTPSHRLRLFISNIKLRPKRSRRRVVVIEAIGDLPPPTSIHDIPNHEYVPLSPRKERRIRRLRWGEALIRYMGAEGKVYYNYVRLHPYRLAPTVMGSSRFIHPFEDRMLTVREQARLMGFPDHHVFYGGRDLQYDEVGEAVPVPLARAIAKEVRRFLEKGVER
ncbi:MAG: DNA (cytosine-5-)-methyltransferase [Thermoprotei archaeon]|nr:MAG: DNA (cytosine-5-)-methyltransferase [Thermoprotei archaeon]